MKLDESDYLIINYEKENDCFVQFWKKSPESFAVLKKEFLNFRSYYEKYTPSKTLWLQQNFQLEVNKEMHQWIEENINKPGVEWGNEKVAFVVGKDVLVHLSVMNYFEEQNSVIHPVHFASEKEAREWLNGNINHTKIDSQIKILFEGVDDEGNSIIKIKRASSDIANTIMSFGHLLEENNFLKSNIANYAKLTKREKEIMVIFAQGLRQKEVADRLFISIETLRTHWKNIKKKLNIKSVADVIKYVNSFDMN
ncbi:LuxR C-terminal-related transcriptional regulator [Christiangramia sabulilitoris]|nr:helix-turn-helix transcriptional regulator [Christiangramia sabulilitoris]